MPIRIALLGDIVGLGGKDAVLAALPRLKGDLKADLVIANAENIAAGSGITPELYQKLRQAGVDAVTLGDHAFRKQQIRPTLEKDPAIIRPANLSPKAIGRGMMQLTFTPPGQSVAVPIFVITLIGRLFMTNMPGSDPFVCVDQLLEEIRQKTQSGPRPIILVEMHAEATSEKVAIGWYLNGRATAVFGTHTHVATADHRLLPTGVPTIPGAGDPALVGTAYVTDLGMCGPHDSVLGRRVDRILAFMTSNMPAPFDVADGNLRASGVIVEADIASGRALKIERFDLPA